MGDPIESMLSRPEFRGLWRSRCIEDDGVSEGWAVTFVMNGDYCETPYQPSPLKACVKAHEILDRETPT